MRRLALCAVLALGAACAPDAPSPLKVQVLAPQPQPDQGHFALTVVTLTTLDDLAHLSGAPAFIQSGVVIRVDPAEIKSNDLNAIRQTIVKNAGSPFAFGYFVDKGVVWPEDWHSLNAVTTYWNFERA